MTTETHRGVPPARRLASGLAAAVAAGSLIAGLAWGANAVGGSDSHCYVGQARMLLEGRLSLAPPLEEPVPWPNAAATFVPSGFAAVDGSSEAVPLCPAGLSLLMVVPMAVFPGGWFLVVPLLGALAVWATFRIGERLLDPATGTAAAALIAVSPIFLHQLFQPMSDVPAAALWAASLAAALRRAPDDGGRALDAPAARGATVAAGALAGVAILVRPNLAPLAVVPLLLGVGRSPMRTWWRPALGFAAGTAPGMAAVAVMQALVYGSPLRSGYGSLQDLFSLAHVWPNLARYPAWLIASHTAVVALALLGPVVVRPRRVGTLLLAFAVATLGLYLPYVVFDDWWYIRFLLPALPVVIVLLTAVARTAVARLSPRVAGTALLAATVAVGGAWVWRAIDLGVFQVKTLERKYPELGRYAAARLPANAVVIAAQPTGAIRFYAKLPTLAWDAIDPAWLDRVVSDLDTRGHDPWLAIEAWETDAFRGRFGAASPLGGLDWPPRASIGRAITVYRFADRARYLAGERIPTERLRLP